MLPDDGTDIMIKQQLRNEKNVNRVVSVACRGVKNLQAVKTRLGRLPEPILGRIITIIVTATEADEVFDFVCDIAQIGQPNRGALVQTTLLGATRYNLPDFVAKWLFIQIYRVLLISPNHLF